MMGNSPLASNMAGELGRPFQPRCASRDLCPCESQVCYLGPDICLSLEPVHAANSMNSMRGEEDYLQYLHRLTQRLGGLENT